MRVSNVLETGVMLVIINVEFHVKYDLPQFLNWFLDISESFSFNFVVLESEGSQKRNPKNVDKYDSFQRRSWQKIILE